MHVSTSFKNAFYLNGQKNLNSQAPVLKLYTVHIVMYHQVELTYSNPNKAFKVRNV